jgi:hypothetical protein
VESKSKIKINTIKEDKQEESERNEYGTMTMEGVG